MTKMRIKAYSRRERLPQGYVGHETIHYQDLQTKRLLGWKTIDTEVVPSHVMIALGCFGDTSGWVSKFAELGSFGRDGIIH